MIVGVTEGSVFLLVLLLMIELALFITISALWFRSMQRAMAACHPVSRSADPDSIWLNFIPVFGFFWVFICTSRISDSLAREYHRRGWHSDENRLAFELGVVAGVVICICMLIRVIFALPLGIGFIMTLVMCFCMYRHMDRLNSFRERLEKEFDPTTAFGQIPVMQQIVATAFNSKQPLPVTQESLAEQLRSAYTNIPFVPQTSFVPESTDVPPPKNESDMTSYSPYLPPETVTEKIPDTQDNVNRWAPPTQKT